MSGRSHRKTRRRSATATSAPLWMRWVADTFCLCLLLVSLPSCEKATTSSKPSSPAPSPSVSRQKLLDAIGFEAGAAKFDVCGLIRSEEVRAIVGSTITRSNGSARSNGRFRISQCIYLASQPDQSISLVVTQTDPFAPQKGSPRDFWRERFGRYREQENKQEVEEEGEETEEGRPPRRIEGVGEEAFWTAGSLYVLQKDAFLRLSIGGSAPEETKLEHAKALATLALKRL